ncbi:hypothetical protein SCHPADRAFT_935413 [Schizopora paradoxa]|uniref:CNH domain-containing protein n=1 Tax=Schizopora paradoxa TaxID=27342 RepID=A0A0H2S509_9AGAM|nr:hypothetical protein SCHPADRAFT_935413 [Schizopora paradoxa]
MSFGSIAAPEVPPYQLQPLVSSVFDAYRPEIIENDAPASESLLGFSFTKAAPVRDRERKQDVIVTCAQAYGSEIYVGCSDGALLRFGLRSSGRDESYTLLSSQKVAVAYGSTAGMNKGVEEIIVLPSISRALVLCDHTVHFYILPALDPVPQQSIRPIRGVLALAVDELYLRPGSTHEHEPVEFSVVKKSAIMQYSLKERLVMQREFNNQGMIYARRAGRVILAADRENYNVIDLTTASCTPLLPIDQTGETPSRVRPMITFLGQSEPIEFLLASATGAGSSMGLFISGTGDPVRGTLEWPSHPESLCLDFPYVLTLMRNKTIEVHNVETQNIAQVVSPASTTSTASPTLSSPQRSSSSPKSTVLEPRRANICPAGFVVPASQGTDSLRLVSVTLSPSLVEDGEEKSMQFTLPPSDSLLPSSSSTQSASRQANLPRARSIVISSTVPEPGQKATWALQALLPATLVSQAEALLPPQAQRIEEAIELAESAQRRMLGTGEASGLSSEIQYVYQRAGWQRFVETRWVDAGNYLQAGEIDPRVLVRYFPDLRGGLLDDTPFVDVFAGVASCLPTDGSVEEIIAANLVRNYSPHLRPEGTKEAKPTAELHRLLCAGSKEMLATYLRRWRVRRLFARGADANAYNVAISIVVDTVLVKLLADADDTTSELQTLIDEPNDIVLNEVEEPLRKNGHYNALVKLYQKAGDTAKLLDAWSKLVDGIWVDEDIKDPLEKMVDLLSKSADKALVQQWGLWLTARSADLGLRLLTSKDFRRGSKSDETDLLQQIRETSADAGRKYLEHLVLRRRSQDSSLHDQLASICIDQVLEGVADSATSKLWRAKASSYVSSSSDMPFLTYFAQTTPESPHRQARLKTCLFLQGSSLYSPEKVLSLLQDTSRHQGADLLRFELAILFAKLGRHEDAIQQLVRGVGDAVSAEAYCTTGGNVVTGRVAMQVGDMAGLKDWASLVTGIAPSLAGASSTMSSTAGRGTPLARSNNFSSSSGKQKVVDEETRAELLKVLLRVYMSGGEATARRTTRLLNSQAINLDVVDVIDFVPSDWPLSGMASFLSRSFRRTQHAKNEGQIIKAISAGQNVEVVEQSYLVIREQGAVIEEEDVEDEKVLNEKVGQDVEDDGSAVFVPPGAPGTSLGSVAEIRVGGGQDGGGDGNDVS